MHTTNSTTAKTAALAILAVARHAVDNDVTADSIDAPITHGDPITIKVRSTHLDAWLNTMTLDEGPMVKPVGDAQAYETVQYAGRVPGPIGEVRVRLLAVRRREGLHVVPAGAAS